MSLKGFFRELVAWLRKRAYPKFSLGLVAIGAGCFAPPELWEFLYGLLAPLVQWLVKTAGGEWEAPSAPHLEPSVPQMLLGVALICTGLLVFSYFDKRSRDDERKRDFLTVSVDLDRNWVQFDAESKESDDPKFKFYLTGRLHSGQRPILLLNFSAIRYASGCQCWNMRPSLQIDGVKIEFDGRYHIDAAVTIAPYSSPDFKYSRMCKAPLRDWNPDYLADGDIAIKLTYRFADEAGHQELSRIYHQKGGQLVQVEKLAPPPILNDEQLESAFSDGAISDEEVGICKRLSEEDRYLIIRGGANAASTRNLSPNQVMLLEKINEKVYAHELLLSREASP